MARTVSVSSADGRDRVLDPIAERVRLSLVRLAARYVSPDMPSRKYSEDEPRDDAGRWTVGGGVEVDPSLAKFLFPATAEAVTRTLDGLTRHFPVPCRVRAYADLKDNSVAFTAGPADHQTISINSTLIDYPESAGWFASPGPEGVATHEYGHAVDAWLTRDMTDPATAEYRQWRGALVASQGVTGYPSTWGKPGWGPLSRYGQTDPHEAVAEAFSAAYSPTSTQRDNPAAVALRDVLGRVWPSSANKYSEDEPRDERGRWTNGGSGVNDAVYSARRDAADAMARMTPKQMASYVTERTGTEVRTWDRRVNREAFREAMAQYIALHDQFPWVPVKSIAVAPTAPRVPGLGATIAQTRYSGYYPDSTINLTPSQWATPLVGRDTGFLTPENSNPAGYITHEFGHAVDQASLFAKATIYPGTPLGFRVTGPFHDLPPISGYGRTSDKEKFAELFAATYAQPTAPPDQRAAMEAYMTALSDAYGKPYEPGDWVGGQVQPSADTGA